MATSRIKIEVDYEKARVKVDDLKISFDQLGTKVVATRNRITKAIGSTNDAVKGSLKALMRERDEWKNIQASLSTTSAAYAKYQGQIDKLDAKIAKITDTRNKEQKALKNSANGLRAQISAMQTEMDNRILSNRQYRIANEQLQILKDKLEALTDTRKEHEIVQEGSIAHYDQEIQVRMDMLRNMNLEAEAIERIEQEITSLNSRKGEAVAKTKSLSKAMEGTSSSAGAAGATVTEFGRTIGDAPFGLMGMANNLQQLSQQFVDLQAKSGGTNKALKSILSTMMGPAGLVVAINIVTSAIVAYNMRKDKAKEKTEEFNESMLLETAILKQLTNMYKAANDSLGERNQIISSLAAADSDYAKALAELGNNEDARNELTEKYLEIRNRINDSEENRNKIADENKELLSEELLSKEERNELERQYADLLDGPVNESTGRAIGRIKGQLNLDDQRREANKEILKSTNDIADAQEELNRLLNASDYDEAIQELKAYNEELRVTRNFTEGTERIAEEIRVLQKKLSDEAVKAGTTETAAYQKILLDLRKKEDEYYQASIEERQEAADKEKERLDSLAEINQEYTDNLEAQGDELGIIRLNQAERDALAEAEALGAGQDVINKITQDFANRRQEILDKDAEERAEKARKAAEKQAKEDEKIKEESLKNNEKKLEEYFNREIEMMKARTDAMSDVMSNFSNLLDELGSISESRYERQLNNLKNERDIINADNTLTKEEKVAQLTEIQNQENAVQTKRIKAERDMFTLKQTITIAEMIMKQKAMVQEQIMIAQLATAKASLAANEVAVTGAKEAGKAQMSLGTFMSTLGPFGVAAFALSIGSVIASIVSARKKARAEIAGLSNAPISVSGGSSSGAAAPSIPDFNVVGSSTQNQLAQAISGSQQKPVKAYVVSSDVSTAQEMDRKTIDAASI